MTKRVFDLGQSADKASSANCAACVEAGGRPPTAAMRSSRFRRRASGQACLEPIPLKLIHRRWLERILSL